METLATAGLTLFGSIIAFYVAVAAFFIFLIILEYSDNGFGSFLTIAIFLLVTYFWSNLPFREIFTLLNVSLYIGIGFIYSLIRTYFKGRELEDDEKKYFDLKYYVSRWWSLWPISMINWLFGSLLKDAYNWIYSKTAKIYESLFGMPENEKESHEY